MHEKLEICAISPCVLMHGFLNRRFISASETKLEVSKAVALVDKYKRLQAVFNKETGSKLLDACVRVISPPCSGSLSAMSNADIACGVSRRSTLMRRLQCCGTGDNSASRSHPPDGPTRYAFATPSSADMGYSASSSRQGAAADCWLPWPWPVSF